MPAYGDQRLGAVMANLLGGLNSAPMEAGKAQGIKAQTDRQNQETLAREALGDALLNTTNSQEMARAIYGHGAKVGDGFTATAPAYARGAGMGIFGTAGLGSQVATDLMQGSGMAYNTTQQGAREEISGQNYRTDRAAYAPVALGAGQTLFDPGQTSAAPATLGNAALTFAHPDQKDLDTSLANMLGGVAEKYGGLVVQSGRRSHDHNKAVGGSKGSTHLSGTGADLNLSGMSAEKRAALVNDLVASGAKGIITYTDSPDLLHVDMGSSARGHNGVHFMHDRSNANMKNSPGWVQGAYSQYQGQTLPANNPAVLRAPVPGYNEAQIALSLGNAALGNANAASVSAGTAAGAEAADVGLTLANTSLTGANADAQRIRNGHLGDQMLGEIALNAANANNLNATADSTRAGTGAGAEAADADFTRANTDLTVANTEAQQITNGRLDDQLLSAMANEVARTNNLAANTDILDATLAAGGPAADVAATRAGTLLTTSQAAKVDAEVAAGIPRSVAILNAANAHQATATGDNINAATAAGVYNRGGANAKTPGVGVGDENFYLDGDKRFELETLAEATMNRIVPGFADANGAEEVNDVVLETARRMVMDPNDTSEWSVAIERSVKALSGFVAHKKGGWWSSDTVSLGNAVGAATPVAPEKSGVVGGNVGYTIKGQ